MVNEEFFVVLTIDLGDRGTEYVGYRYNFVGTLETDAELAFERAKCPGRNTFTLYANFSYDAQWHLRRAKKDNEEARHMFYLAERYWMRWAWRLLFLSASLLRIPAETAWGTLAESDGVMIGG